MTMCMTTTAGADVTLGFPFTDNMVLQRGIALPVWGKAAPGEPVAVSFAGQRKETTTDAEGRWSVRLDPLSASAEPAELSAEGKNRAVIRNVLVGEVWICSGQSNMELKVEAADNASREIAEARHPAIRLFHAPQLPAAEPLESVHGVQWVECSPATVGSFSAAGYYFGRELQKKLGVPVGLIDASWGGTKAEFWMSGEALANIPATAPSRAARDAKIAHSKLHSQAPLYALPPEVTADVRNGGFPLGWADLAEPRGDWRDIELPAQWQQRGLDFSGILWFRKTVEIPEEWAGRELSLSVGAVDKGDTTYFNNVKAGGFGMEENRMAYAMNREYVIPAAESKAGKAVVAVRVHSFMFDGGMTGPAGAMRLTCPSLPGASSIRLDGTWKYAVEANYGLRNCNLASSLFNGMISPWTRFGLRGALWYQGESNEFVPALYDRLLPGLIADWRAHWNLGDFPFLIVQLPNYRAPSPYNDAEKWPILRDAQRSALRLPHTGLIPTIDLGMQGDVHPTNKQDVGIRAARNALQNVYGEKIEGSGPLFESAKREGAAMRVRFSHAGGLAAKGGEPLQGFAICGADRRFIPAQARIENASVVVSNPCAPEPLAVRYAWADNPVCNLYNGAGLPAYPFRTDSFDLFGDRIQLNGSLDNARIKFTGEKKGTVAFLGGSITEMDGYRPIVSDWLQKKFPETKFEFINAGIGSTTSTTGAFRLRSHVLDRGPVDLLFLEFAVNDDQDGDHSRAECVRGMEGIVRHALRDNPKMDIVITYFVNEPMLQTLREGKTPMRIGAHQSVVDHYRVPAVHLAAEAAREVNAGELTWEQYGGVHPAPFGNAICARMIFDLLSFAWQEPLPKDARAVDHALPAPLDPLNYENGRFIDPREARVVKGWSYGVPDWKKLPGSKRPWFSALPMLSATEPGAELSFDFEGTAAGAFVIAGPDAGIVETSVDGGPFRPVEVFHAFSKGLHYPRTVLLAADLRPGRHTVTLRMSEKTGHGGHAMRVLHFTAN